MNRLLGIVLDVEYLYNCVHREEDPDTKQVYFSLFKVGWAGHHLVCLSALVFMANHEQVTLYVMEDPGKIGI